MNAFKQNGLAAIQKRREASPLSTRRVSGSKF
jgi:hypothetical protein